MANPTNEHYVYALQIVDYLYTYKSLVMRYEAPADAGDLAAKFYSKTSAPHADSNLGLQALSAISPASSGSSLPLPPRRNTLASPFAQKEAAWLVRLLYQLDYVGDDAAPLQLYGDNQPSIDLVASEGHHERTKHVDIYYYYIKDAVKDGKIKLTHVPTADMAADGLTKPLDKTKHAAWVAQVGMRLPLILGD
jgi:hypothetical protein